MKRISLNGSWSLTGKLQTDPVATPIHLTAAVPGMVQLDLSEEGYLPRDLYMGENITKTEAFEDFEWWYERKFNAPMERKNVFP